MGWDVCKLDCNEPQSCHAKCTGSLLTGHSEGRQKSCSAIAVTLEDLAVACHHFSQLCSVSSTARPFVRAQLSKL
eukprot:3048989-Amphidinium_carterae.2